MCTNGARTEQLEQMIDHIDDHIALEYRWTHKLAHTADDAGFIKASKSLHNAQMLLADVRAALDEAKASFAADAQAASVNDAVAHLV
jgi:phage-related protein